MTGNQNEGGHAGGVTLQQIFEMLMESQYWPPEDMLEYQRSQLEPLLRHAKANVPFYESRLDCVFRRDGSIDWERWEDIPIVTRADLRDRHEEMQARVLPAHHGATQTNFSSGSSGVPIKVTNNQLAYVVRGANWRRFYAAHGLLRKLRHAECKIKHSDGTLFTDPAVWAKVPIPNGFADTLYMNRRLPAGERLDLLKHHAIDALTDMPHGLMILADENSKRADPIRLVAAISFGMGVLDHERKRIEQSFGCAFLTPYSSKEGGLIAYNCPDCERYHVCSESVYAEVVDCVSPSSTDTKSKTMLITPLFATAQPLIRYRQGDEVLDWRSGSTPCAGGYTLASVSGIIGRVDPMFRFSGAAVVPHSIHERHVAELLEASAFQIAQIGANEIEVRIVAPLPPGDEAMAWISSHCRQFYSPNISVKFAHVNELPFGPTGKQNRYVQEHVPIA